MNKAEEKRTPRRARLASFMGFWEFTLVGLALGLFIIGAWFLISQPMVLDPGFIERSFGACLIILALFLFWGGWRIIRRLRDHGLERQHLQSRVEEVENRYRTMFDNAIEGMFQASLEGRFIVANHALASIFGYNSADELVARITDIAHQIYVNPQSRADLLRELEAKGTVSNLALEAFRKDGRTIWTLCNARAVRSERGKIEYIEGTVQDITERLWAEKRRNLNHASTVALAETNTVAEARARILRSVCEVLELDMGAVWNVEGSVLRCGEVWHSPSVDIDEFQEVTSRMAVPRAVGLAGRVWHLGEPEWLELSQHGKSREVEVAIRVGMRSAFGVPIVIDGDIRHVLEFFSTRISQPDAEIMLLLAGIGDLLERKRRDEALRESELRKAAILEAALDGVVTLDAAGRITDFNPAAERMFGCREKEVLGNGMERFIATGSLAHYQLDGFDFSTEKSRNNLLGRRFELLGKKHDGDVFPLEIVISRITSLGSTCFTTYLRDLSAQKSAEREHSELAAVVEYSTDAIVGLTLDGMVVSWNAGAEQIYGYSANELVGRPIYLLLPADRIDELPRSLTAAKRGESLRAFETVRLRKDGRRIDVSLTESPIRNERGDITGISSIARDITEKKRLELQLLQSQKMEAVGRLAGGVAHDFNNILTALLGYTDLAMRQIDAAHPAHHSLKEVRRASELAASLTNQLLAFSRRQALQLRTVSLNEVINNIYRMFSRLIGENIQIMWVPGEPLFAVKADSTQVEQVILNLAVNARDAMPQGGVLTIQTNNRSITPADVTTEDEIPPGDYVELSVSDTGAGMSEEVARQCFDPFFTTKEIGKGTGLGLATCYGIIKQSGGYITVESALEQGTTFRILLPRSSEDVSTGLRDETGTQLPGGNETLLVVEDEPAVRKLAVHILRRLGYTVLEAGTVEAARNILTARTAQNVNLLLTDVVLPQSNGRELADWALTEVPDLAVVYMSGYVEETVMQKHGIPPDAFFLQKPFTPASLAAKLRDALSHTKRHALGHR